MKTRKVGRVLSLLLAIAMVVGLMIPASSVLAATVDTSFNDGEAIVVKNFAQLKAALEGAATDGTKTYIKLADVLDETTDVNGNTVNDSIQIPSFVSNYQGAENKYYLETIVKLRDVKKRKSGLTWVSKDTITNYEIFYETQGCPYYGKAYFFSTDWRHADVSEAKLLGMDKDAIQINGNDPKGYDEKLGKEYENCQLIVRENTNVVLDLNGKHIRGLNNASSAFTGTPNTQMSTFTVEGNAVFTLIDRVGGGTVEGGTGNVMETMNYYNGSETLHSVVLDDSRTNFQYPSSWVGSTGRYAIHFLTISKWAENAIESHGGGVFVASGGEFILAGGSITNNCAWMSTGEKIFASGINAVSKGGGVYVDAGGTFTMYGGEVTQNAARAYNKSGTDGKDSQAYGGGIYLADAANGKTATFNMYGGKIAENAAYAVSGVAGKTNQTQPATAKGAGIYIGQGATANILGSAAAEGPTTAEILASFPQITNNSCGAITRYHTNGEVKVEGAGIYCAGTLNIKKAVVSANDFSEFANDLGNNDMDPVKGKTVHLSREAGSGLAQYVYDYNSDGSAKTLITRLDDRFTENLQIATEVLNHEKSGIYGSHKGYEKEKMTSNGAGVCLTDTAKMVVGERTWINDNYDLLTQGHKDFNNARNYAKHWDKTLNGVGGYVYTGSYTANISDGYCWSDSSDDVYLPEGVAMYKGESLFECKIGVNYWNMVNADGAVSAGAMGQAGNRVIVKSSTNLDPDIWGTTSSTPSQRDIQFFSLNDNNKAWERDNYPLPSWVVAKYNYGGVNYNAELCDPELTTSYDNRVRVTVVDADSVTQAMKDASPFTGYIDYDHEYPANTWIYGVEAVSVSNWAKYGKATYKTADPDKDPTKDSTQVSVNNKNVVPVQRAYQLSSDSTVLNTAINKALLMDYKVVYDDNGFGTDAAPVLRFGKGVDRKMFVSVDFDEANVHYFGKNTANQSLNSAISIDDFVTSNAVFKIIDKDFTFYGANKPTGTIEFKKVVPDYSAYKGVSVLNDRINNRTTEKTSITKTNGIEDKDLYFKGWSFYSSYEYGPEITTLSNKDAIGTVGVDSNASSLYYRGTFTADLSRIFNSNVNAQPCPSLTATWYTQEELAEARRRVSNVMGQTVIREDGTELLRVVSIAGTACMGDDCDEVGFVISTTNATPTFEGGYDYVAKSRIYEKLGKHETADDNSYYDTDYLLTGSYTGYTVPIVDARWSFTEDSEFARNVTTGTYKAGYKDAGLFYANIVITDANRNTVYFVTPYAKFGNTYYYGESRAVCYADHA